MRRSVSVVIIDRANLGRLQPLLEEFRKSDLFDLSVVCGGSTLASGVADSLQGHYRVHRVSHLVSGGTLHETGLSIGLGTLGYVHAFKELSPDYVLLIGDRSEALAAATAAATAAAHCGSQIVHLQGGEKSSTLDQKYRWAITALADWHVPATRQAQTALLLAGVPESRVLAVGCPSADFARGIEQVRDRTNEVLACYHPNTCHPDTAWREAEQFYAALPERATVLSTNCDAGGELVRRSCEKRGFKQVSISPLDFANKLATVACAVGNSSGFVRDSGFYGTPVVLVGDRQDGRECGDNVVRVPCLTDAIKRAIDTQIKATRNGYRRSWLYGSGNVSERIVAALANLGRAA